MLTKLQKVAFKIFFGLLGFSAIVTEMVVLIERGMFLHVRFFAYFTIQVNILVYFTLILSAVFTAIGQGKRIESLRTAVTTYILMVGIGFAVLLSHLTNMTFSAVPWDNVVLHYIMPLAVLADFLLDRPTQKISWRQSLRWFMYPLVYLVFTLVRGFTTGWYPYPFLNIQKEGWLDVMALSLGLLVVTLVVQMLFAKKGPTKARR